MLAEILLSGLVGIAIVIVIYFFWFNTKQVQDLGQKKNDKKQREKNQLQTQQKTKSPNKRQNKQKKAKNSILTRNAAKNKPRINLSDETHFNLVSVFRGHTGDITGIAWHQSGKYLLSCSKDKWIYIWDNPKQPQITDAFIGCVQAQDNGYFSAINTIIIPTNTKNKYLNNNKYSNCIFASTNGCHALNSYNLKYAAHANKFRFQLTSNIQTEYMREDIECICISSSLAFIAVSASSTHNTKIYFYDIKRKQRESKNKKIKLNVAIDSLNKTESRRSRARQISAAGDKAYLCEIIDSGLWINYEMNLSANNEWLSIGTYSKDIRLWRIHYIKPNKKDSIQEIRFGGILDKPSTCTIINAHKAAIMCVTFSCNSKFMISVAKDGYCKVWDIYNCDYKRGYKPQIIINTHLKIGEIHKLVISYQFDIIAVLNQQKQIIYIYQIKYEKKKIKFHCKFDNILCRKGSTAQINCIKFSPDSQFVAVGTNDFDVRVYKIPAHKKHQNE